MTVFPIRHILIGWLVMVFVLTGQPATATTGGKLSATDFRGKTVTLQKPAKRIVCLIESALSGLYMLGAEQQVVGVSANIYNSPVNKWYAAMDERIKHKKLPAPGNWDFISLESIVTLKPDLVIIWSQQTEAIASLEKRGIPVYAVMLKGHEDIYKEILDLGILTGRVHRAAELVKYSKLELERLAKRTAAIAPANRPSVYYMWAQGNLETSCGGSTVNDLIKLAGARNVCEKIPSEHLVVNLEKILTWNPDVIVMWFNERKNPSDIINDPQWRYIKAVKSRHVYELPDVFLCDLWTLKFQHTVKMLAKWANPKQFKDLDLEKEQQTMLNKLYGRKLKGI